MIAVDSSSWIAYLSGEDGVDVKAVEDGLAQRRICLPPVVVTELLSDPELPANVAPLIRGLPQLEILDGYWERAGLLRSRVLAARHRARLADTLIAQSCLDHDLPLVARDSAFRHFARIGGLKLVG